MTDLRKAIKRVVRGRPATKWSTRERQFVVTIEPPDTLSIREKRQRQSFSVSLSVLYDRLVWQEARDRIEAKRWGKKRGRR